jgi:hypothetical protein
MNGEDAFIGLRVFGDDAVLRPDFRFLRPCAAASTSGWRFLATTAGRRVLRQGDARHHSEGQRND